MDNQTNNRIRDEWREKCKEYFHNSWRDEKEADWWLSKIAELLKSQKENSIPLDKLNEIIGGGYYFEDMCESARNNTPPFCHHFDCIKAIGINLANKNIRDGVEDYKQGKYQ